MGRFERWAPYVPVAQRRRNAENEAKRLAKNGTKLNPLRIAGRNIATTFWGKAWCENLEDYCDFDNRMPRGRTYARNGSVVDLQVNKGTVTGLVSGSSLYKISIVIDPLSAKAWGKLCQDCSQEVVSLLDLMRGKLSNAVIQRLTDPKDGLFPQPKEIKVTCSCPDYASMCKHVAAVLYGVGHRLDSSPELFFELRGVDQAELVTQALALQNSSDVMGLNQSSDLAYEKCPIDCWYVNLPLAVCVSMKHAKSRHETKYGSLLYDREHAGDQGLGSNDCCNGCNRHIADLNDPVEPFDVRLGCNGIEGVSARWHTSLEHVTYLPCVTDQQTRQYDKKP